MRIGIFTDDWTTVSAHPGRASGLIVVRVESGDVATCENVEFSRSDGDAGNFYRMRRRNCGGRPANGRCRFPFEPETDNFGLIVGSCDAVAARGMGFRLSERLSAAGIRVITTDLAGVDEALSAILSSFAS